MNAHEHTACSALGGTIAQFIEHIGKYVDRRFANWRSYLRHVYRFIRNGWRHIRHNTPFPSKRAFASIDKMTLDRAKRARLYHQSIFMRNKRYAFPTNNHSKSHDSTITSYRTQSPNRPRFLISARFSICISAQFRIRHASKRAHHHIYPITRRSIRIDPRRNSHYHLGQPRNFRKHDPRTRSNRRSTRR